MAVLPLGPSLYVWPVLPPEAMVASESGLCHRAPPSSMDLPQTGSALIFVAPVTLKALKIPGSRLLPKARYQSEGHAAAMPI